MHYFHHTTSNNLNQAVKPNNSKIKDCHKIEYHNFKNIHENSSDASLNSMGSWANKIQQLGNLSNEDKEDFLTISKSFRCSSMKLSFVHNHP